MARREKEMEYAQNEEARWAQETGASGLEPTTIPRSGYRSSDRLTIHQLEDFLDGNLMKCWMHWLMRNRRKSCRLLKAEIESCSRQSLQPDSSNTGIGAVSLEYNYKSHLHRRYHIENVILGMAAGTAAGIIGTGLGGAFAFLLKNPSRRWLSAILSMSAGLMIAVVCFDLLPRSFELGGFGTGLAGTAAGVIAIAALQELLFYRKSGKVKGSPGKNYLRTGILIGTGIALHNFPEGLAIGAGFASYQTFGVGLSIIIAHDLPEELLWRPHDGRHTPCKRLFWQPCAGVPRALAP